MPHPGIGHHAIADVHVRDHIARKVAWPYAPMMSGIVWASSLASPLRQAMSHKSIHTLVANCIVNTRELHGLQHGIVFPGGGAGRVLMQEMAPSFHLLPVNGNHKPQVSPTIGNHLPNIVLVDGFRVVHGSVP